MLIFSKVPATAEGLTPVIQQDLRWIGHVINLLEHSLPKRIPSGKLLEDHRNVREQKKNLKRKVMLKECDVNPAKVEVRSDKRNNLKTLCSQPIERFETSRTSPATTS